MSSLVDEYNKNPFSKIIAFFDNNRYEKNKNIEGRLLTIIDGAFTDPIQREAVKSMIRQVVWSDEFWHTRDAIENFTQVFKGEVIEELKPILLSEPCSSSGVVKYFTK